MTNRPDLYSIVLFFTRGVSLRSWDQGGLFEREVALYRRLQSHGVKVTFVTYGDSTDLEYGYLIPGITICCNKFHIPAPLYARLINWLHRKHLLAADLIKTNQTMGADVAVQTALNFRKPLISRCGYLLSEFAACEFGAGSHQALQALEIESKIFGAADAIVVTTHAMRKVLLDRKDIAGNKILVIPNYVDTNTFAPEDSSLNSDGKRVCFIGRLETQKNIRALIEAVHDTDVYLDIVGQGNLRAALEAAAENNPRITFHGPVPNHSLPQYIRRSTAFILPSLYEGHPKVLIEAMACGLPVIGSNVTGINEVIRHGETGLLCGTTATSIRSAITTIISDQTLREHLGRNARKYVVENYSLDLVVGNELAMYHDVIRRRGNHC